MALIDVNAAVLQVERPRRPARRRKKSNRRVEVQRPQVLLTVAEGFGMAGRILVAVARTLARVLVLVGLSLALVGGGRLLVESVTRSPRFALQQVEIGPVTHISAEEVLRLSGVVRGDRLLSLDTDAIAGRSAEHPWVAEARVRRRLPSSLTIDVVERQAVASINLGGLYLVDDTGRPFKKATMAEAEGLVALTGLERPQYVDLPQASEAAAREALGILRAWQADPARPPLSEINMSPRYGFSLLLLESGAEIRLGRGQYDRKLARLDQIFEAMRKSGDDPADIRVVHLDGENQSRIHVGLHVPPEPTTVLE